MRRLIHASMALFAAFSLACGSEEERSLPDASGVPDSGVAAGPDAGDPFDTGGSSVPDGGTIENLISIPAESQRSGDPAQGYDTLVNGAYIGCGIPWTAYRVAFGDQAPEALRLPGRTGRNEVLPYYQTAYTTTSTVEVVMTNCLLCHAAFLEDHVVVGLGNINADYTIDPSQSAELAGLLLNDPDERAEWRKWADRVQAVAPYIQTKVVGVNPADNLTAALMSRRDRVTLEWSDVALLEPPPTHVLPVDVPPWWRMKKKNAMFYTAAGRGDHSRMMMMASTLCVDSVDEARAIWETFDDVRAYIESIEAPPYPRPIDQALADQGEDVFAKECFRCHGRYGDSPVYPNFLVPLEEVKTDPSLADASGAVQFAQRFVDWFNGSFYGETARMEPLPGYVAPPLDGIWATAPYLHNGSVPTIAALLDSKSRPTYWTRNPNAIELDYDNLGLVYTELDHGQAAEPSAAVKRTLYDTTILGYGNRGHTFGDDLTAEEKQALIEYLKTL